MGSSACTVDGIEKPAEAVPLGQEPNVPSGSRICFGRYHALSFYLFASFTRLRNHPQTHRHSRRNHRHNRRRLLR